MAGDWIKMRTDLSTDPAVIATAARLHVDEDTIVGKLHRLWSWANHQTTDGNAVGVTADWIDRYLACEGFAKALSEVGWLMISDDGIQLPEFGRHNGESAKKRAQSTKRVQKHRNEAGQKSNAQSVSPALPEKRREEKRRRSTTTPSPPVESVRQHLPSSPRWNQVVEDLITIGIVDPHPAVEAARCAGGTPEMVDAILEHAQGKPGAWGPGAIRNRVAAARHELPVDQGWPPPSEDYERRRRAFLEGEKKQSEQAKRIEENQRRDEGKRIDDERERTWGPKLEGMDQADRDQLAVATLGETGPAIQRYRKHGATGIARLEMLVALAKEDERQ